MSNENKTLDLSMLDSVSHAEEGAPLKLLHPVTGEPFGMTITLCGADSKRYQDKKYALMREHLRGNRRMVHLDLESAETDAIAILATCTIGWEDMKEHGEAVKFSVEKAKDIYARYPAIREQVSVFVETRANFLPPLEEG